MRVYNEETDKSKIRKKLVIVGDGNCGKTCLLVIQSGLPFPEAYVPTIFENYISRIEIGKKTVDMSLWDTAGQEDYDRLRPLSYPDTDVVILAFNLMSHDSLENVREKWHPETKHFLQDVPRILIGCKKDLRDDASTVEKLRKEGGRPVTYEQGVAMMQALGALKYFETSAKTGEGIKEAFQAATKLSMKQKTRFQKCRMM